MWDKGLGAMGWVRDLGRVYLGVFLGILLDDWIGVRCGGWILVGCVIGDMWFMMGLIGEGVI